MEFNSLCDFFNSLRCTKGQSEKANITKSLINNIRRNGEHLFGVLRLVLPKLDRDRPAYKIKESKISKLLIKMLDLSNGNDRNNLLKSVTVSSMDFGDVIYSVLKKYIIDQNTTITIEDINIFLDKIAYRSSDNGLDDLILEIFRKLSPKGIKWFIQIILKELKLGISDNTILNCLHPDGANFYSANNNLKKVCDTLLDPNAKIHELGINLFEPFQPMLSKRCDSSNFKKSFPDGRLFLIENKFDGERFQMHMQNGMFKYFSRNGFDFTTSYGASYDAGSLTPRLKNTIDSEVKNVILDGEMMLWNKYTKKFGSKGMNLDVKKLNEGKYQSCYCVFDILLFNDKVLTNLPLEKRMKFLQKTIKNEVDGTIILSKVTEAHGREDIVKALNYSVDNNEEGIVVKDPNSVYKYSDRNSGWFKIKMEYFDDVVHDLDVLLMGGCYGANRKINSFFVGISSGPNTYLSLGRISSGLNDEQLDMLTDKLQTLGNDYKEFSAKSLGQLHFGRDTPNVYIEPKDSCILQIRATELVRTTSDDVKTPYTLRFPRVLKIRDDKPVEECLSINELLELTKQNKAVIKLNKRHIELKEIVPKVIRKKIKLEIIKTESREKTKVLENRKMYVLSGSERWLKEDICIAIKRAGGDVIYKLDENVEIVLASKIDNTVINLMKKPNKFDIIHVDWLKRVLSGAELVDYDQKEIIKLGFNFKGDLSEDFDIFGDYFTHEASIESIQRIVELMKQSDIFLNVNNDVNIN